MKSVPCGSDDSKTAKADKGHTPQFVEAVPNPDRRNRNVGPASVVLLAAGMIRDTTRKRLTPKVKAGRCDPSKVPGSLRWLCANRPRVRHSALEPRHGSFGVRVPSCNRRWHCEKSQRVEWGGKTKLRSGTARKPAHHLKSS